MRSEGGVGRVTRLTWMNHAQTMLQFRRQRSRTLLQQRKVGLRDSEQDLATLRQNAGVLGRKTGPALIMVQSRLNVELISKLIQLDRSIGILNESSSSLVGATNRLTKRILYLTVVGIVIAAVGAVEVIRRWLSPS
jgi:hypothetical protein